LQDRGFSTGHTIQHQLKILIIIINNEYHNPLLHPQSFLHSLYLNQFLKQVTIFLYLKNWKNWWFQYCINVFLFVIVNTQNWYYFQNKTNRSMAIYTWDWWTACVILYHWSRRDSSVDRARDYKSHSQG